MPSLKTKQKKITAREQFVCQQLADPTACKWAHSWHKVEQLKLQVAPLAGGSNPTQPHELNLGQNKHKFLYKEILQTSSQVWRSEIQKWPLMWLFFFARLSLKPTHWDGQQSREIDELVIGILDGCVLLSLTCTVSLRKTPVLFLLHHWLWACGPI